MARRFGRNQKRAMRNQIQSQEKLLEQHIEHIEQHIKHISSLNHDLRQANEVINLTAEVLGEHFAGLPVKTVEVNDLLERYEYAVRQPACSWANEIDPGAIFVDQALCHIDTYQADARLDEITGNMHMRYKSISGIVAYGISNSTWNTLSEKRLVDMFTEQIANEMAVHLVRERKKALANTYYLARN